jgi:arylsulfatase
MESKRGSPPKKVRPYRLDYRPLIDRDLTDRAISFMRRQARAGNPFFVYLPYTATHFPTMPHPDFVDRSGKGPWGDLLMQIDSYTGELLDTIENLGIADETIFIFTADNGPEALSAGETSMTVETATHGSAGPWRSTLFTGYEGALRVPFAMRWPGRIEAGRVSDEIVHEMDLFPTLARIVGGTVPSDRVIDGIDMAQFLLGRNKESGRATTRRSATTCSSLTPGCRRPHCRNCRPISFRSRNTRRSLLAPPTHMSRRNDGSPHFSQENAGVSIDRVNED